MLKTETMVFWLVLVALGIVAWQFFGKRFFSTEAMDRRRRDRNHGRVISRRQGPQVKLASKVPRS